MEEEQPDFPTIVNNLAFAEIGMIMVLFCENLICRRRTCFVLQFTKSCICSVWRQRRQVLRFLRFWDSNGSWSPLWFFRMQRSLVQESYLIIYKLIDTRKVIAEYIFI